MGPVAWTGAGKLTPGLIIHDRQQPQPLPAMKAWHSAHLLHTGKHSGQVKGRLQQASPSARPGLQAGPTSKTRGHGCFSLSWKETSPQHAGAWAECWRQLRLPLLGPQFLRLTVRSVSLFRAWQVLLLLPPGIQDPVVRAVGQVPEGKILQTHHPA